MDEGDFLATRFEEQRGRLRAVAYRVLGSAAEADDAVQEAWLRLSRTDAGTIDNLGAWLTTVVARVSLSMLRSRRTRREDPLDTHTATASESGADPEQQALLADSVGLALLVVLDTLSPAERLAFVLHDMFAVPFDDIAGIVDRSPAATRQLASRARRRVQGVAVAAEEADAVRRRAVVGAFLAASRGGDFEALLELLDPEVVLRTDTAAALAGATTVRGAAAVAETFVGRAKGARPVLVDGRAGLAWVPEGRPRAVFVFSLTEEGRISQIHVLADGATIDQLDVVLLDGA
ncbi:RNA polymerase sigma-70 factor, ECF subfamily [Actinacidiphila alni]|uniref:RNA polymerase sigma-70 factor, ECF subfamily n=1 Tax=Actinacidiphila alni TaxID=380248 RepID=A0A1I1ZIU3_9ACTN|nr:sigma-70 family RNA polymerase sigma factor [Actinacidiphila alni]SFE31607.1 RNA polymerase sigma-70 factor, ECF subfamily [Actinacidiphila alni]